MRKRLPLALAGLLLLPVILAGIGFASWYSTETNTLEAGSTIVQTELGPVEYALTGEEGPVVLSIHGVTGGYDMGLEIGDMLGLQNAGFRVLAVSRPGYLRTPLNDLRTPAQQADLYAALLDELAIEQVAVLGVSGGGPSSLAFANAYSERVWGMVMAVTVTHRWDMGMEAEEATAFENTPPLFVDLGLWYVEEIQMRFMPRQAIGQVVDENTLLEGEARDALIEAINNDPTRLENTARSVAFPTPMGIRWDGTFNDIEQQMQLPLEPDYNNIRAPVLAFYGEQDALVPTAHAEYLTANLPEVELHLDAEAGHSLMVHEGWSFVQQRTIEFLREHIPAAQRDPRWSSVIGPLDPILSITSAAYSEANPDRETSISLAGHGPLTGFCDHNLDITIADRTLNDEEIAACEQNNVSYTGFVVAVDVLAVVVSPANDFVECLSPERLGRMFGAGSRITLWSDVNPEWPDELIDFYMVDNNDHFRDRVLTPMMGEAAAFRQDDITKTRSLEGLSEGINGNAFAIGLLEYDTVTHYIDNVRLIAIENEQGECVLPTDETVENGAYPLTRPIFVYTCNQALREKPHFAEFMAFLLSDEGALATLEDGFGLSLPPDGTYEHNRELLQRILEGENP